ncbi:hypothetical protein FGRMN_8550 [Fusarium graminum]|nr:hypothetical protein FGRMN_8550 [Fusarium graminum]
MSSPQLGSEDQQRAILHPAGETGETDKADNVSLGHQDLAAKPMNRVMPAKAFHEKPNWFEERDCYNCTQKGHRLPDCLYASLKGCIWPCILCHSKFIHAIDECGKFHFLSISEKVRILVTDRAGMTPLQTDLGWWEYLKLWYNSPETKNEEPPSAYPWTQTFAASVTKGERGRSLGDVQLDFQNYGRSTLPVDESMQSLKDVVREYWQDTTIPDRVHAQLEVCKISELEVCVQACKDERKILQEENRILNDRVRALEEENRVHRAKNHGI